MDFSSGRTERLGYNIRPTQLACLWCALFFCLLLSVSDVHPSDTQHTPPHQYRFAEVESLILEKIGVVLGIAQDAQGFMWFGGNNGLARFDGYDVKIFRNDPSDPNSLSNNNITAMVADSQGRIWVATTFGLNLFDSVTNGFIRYTTEDIGSGRLLNNSINDLALDQRGNLWLATLGGGIAKINLQTKKVQSFEIENTINLSFDQARVFTLVCLSNGQLLLGIIGHGVVMYDPKSTELTQFVDTQSLFYRDVYSIFQSHSGHIWLGTEGSGLFRVHPTTKEIKNYQHSRHASDTLSHNVIWYLYEDKQNYLWVATDNALNVYLPEQDKFTAFEYLPGSNQTGKVRSIYKNSTDDMWLGLFPAGVARLDRDAMVFVNYQHSAENTNSLSHTSVTAIVEDTLENLWVGTEKGLNYIDVATGNITRYLNDSDETGSLPSNAILSLTMDSANRLWVGAWKGGWAQFNQQTKQFEPAFVADGHGRHMSDEVWAMYEDHSQRLWVGGLYTKALREIKFRDYQSIYPSGDRLSSIRVKAMLEDRHGVFWLGTKGGLDVLDRTTGRIKHYYHSDVDKHSISDHFINTILEDEEGRLWFGTRAGGVNIYDRATDSFRALRMTDGLADDMVVGMIDDYRGNIWMITGGGLVKYNKQNGTFESFDKQTGLTGSLFHRNAIILTANGDIVFGGVGGLTRFNPDRIKPNSHIPKIVLTELKIFDKVITPVTNPEVLHKPLNLAKKINLKYSDSVFSIQFSSLNYRDPSRNSYAYKLEGFDKTWNKVGLARRATYTNLDPGTYTFRVKGSNNSGVWNEEGAAIIIDIIPPWWMSGWAYAAYACIAMLVFLAAIIITKNLREVKNQRILNVRLRQIDQIKDAFLANTSHELRTPLNGIIGLTETLLNSSDSKLSKLEKEKLKVVVDNGRRLSHIINDLLDFSKLRHHQIVLQRAPIKLRELVSNIFQVVQPLVQQKPVELENSVADSLPTFYADEQRLNQILYNLIGNAIKFTDAGKVDVYAEVKNQSIVIKVKDTGSGIHPNDFERIFEPFEQLILGKQGRFSGSGLGLAVSRQLVDLHGGKIWVVSDVSVGSEFCVELPLGELSKSNVPESKPITALSEQDQKSQEEIADDRFTRIVPQRPFRYRILIVDDEPVNRLVLSGYLNQLNYSIKEVGNGVDALKMLANGQYFDLILLDVMMPRMSGYEVCKKIRENFALYELPVIFLTAKSQIEDMYQGYQVGANDFLCKPVVREEFLAKVDIQLQLVECFKRARLAV